MAVKSFILACDGGGIRGLATAAVLATIEDRLQRINPGKPLHDYFDLIAGTSTGSIVACGLSSGLTARQILDLYLRDGIKIFPPFKKVLKSLVDRLRIGYSQPIYQAGYEDKTNPHGVEPVLQRVFSDPQGKGLLKFGDLEKPTLVTSYDTYNQQFVVFKSRSSECKEIDVWEVARASSAAPVAFPAYELSNKTFIDFWKAQGFQTIPSRSGEDCIPLIDGGLSANNPALCALVERLSWSHDRIPIEEIAILSIGTGDVTPFIGPVLMRVGGHGHAAAPC
ncbi:patatin-like phospholipase family protein [Cyanobium sp. NIES-981]|uniref:patatin-like phospholipase family protein n=1 Tax=Cyanobium sp. NIES-981 TaxID=1851505 RepID=UPI000B34C26B|nr:patatin-like phospholipase family protein [Cyanobium sp. NIES-981]